MTPVLALDRVSRSFGPVEVLRGVDLALTAGEVHALIGENGAGKSTIMNILGGFLPPSSGQVLLDGAPARFASGPQAEAAGIIVIHQEFNLVPDLSVAANTFLGREIMRGWRLDHAAMANAAADLLRRLGTRIAPGSRIRDLSVPERQMVEIAKALSRRARVLIMDEPSAALTRNEVQALYAQVDRLRAEGVAILFCSHRLDEVARLADRVTVLRDGSVVRQALRGELTEAGMASAMVGRDLSGIFPARPCGTPGPELLRVENLTSGRAVADVSLTLAAGEVLGIGGLVGAGRTQLAEAIAGLRPATGRILIDGQPRQIASPRDAMAAGIAYLTEDRKDAGLLLDKPLTENLTLAALDRFGFRIDRRAEAQAMRDATRDFDIRAASPAIPARALSGGNQQKLLLAKTMLTRPRIVLIDEPTRGIDIGTKQQIYAFIRELAGQGRGIVAISSEMAELIGLCDRVLVMRLGRIAGEVTGEAITEDNIARLAMGVGERAA